MTSILKYETIESDQINKRGGTMNKQRRQGLARVLANLEVLRDYAQRLEEDDVVASLDDAIRQSLARIMDSCDEQVEID